MALKSNCATCGECITFANTFSCFDCGADLCDKHAFQRVDEANESITKHAPTLCRACYEKRYGRNNG